MSGKVVTNLGRLSKKAVSYSVPLDHEVWPCQSIVSARNQRATPP